MSLTTSQKETIVKTLKSKSGLACPMCQNKQWTIGDEIVSVNPVSLSGSTVMGGPFIPMVQVVCNNCGFISHHALGLLGVKIKD